jgi:hypothetical protein
MNPLAEEILKYQRRDDDTLDCSGELPEIFDELFEYRPITGKGNSLAMAAEMQSLRKDVLGDDIDDLPKAARPSLSLAHRTAQTVGKAVDIVIGKAARISASAPARKTRITEILDETKQRLEDRGYRAAAWDGWPGLQQHCDEAIISTLMAA